VKPLLTTGTGRVHDDAWSLRRALRLHGLFGRWVLVLPAIAFLGIFFLYPVASMVARSFTEVPAGEGWLDNYRWFFSSDVNITILQRTFVTAGLVTLVCLVTGYPYAYLLTLLRPRWRFVAIALVLVPFWTSLMVRNFAWVAILQPNRGILNSALDFVGLGPVNLLGSVWAVIIGMSQILLPFMILPLYASLHGIDRRLLLAAQGLGARPSIAFARVYLPLSLPGVAAGCLLVFVLSLGFFITPAMLGSPQQALISQLIVTQVSQFLDWGRGGAMSVVLLVITLALLALGALAARRRGAGVALSDAAGGHQAIAPPGRATVIALRVWAVLVGLWLVAPMLVVIPTSFTGQRSFQLPTSWSTMWYDAFFNDARWVDSLLTSLQIALLVTIIATALGTGAALALARMPSFARAPLNGLLLLPIMIPSVIGAIGVYAAFLRWHLVGSQAAFVLAHVCLALPFVVVSVGARLASFDSKLYENAAASLGARPSRAFARVTARLIAPSIVVGALFAFIASFDELVVALFLIDPTISTLPVEMFSSVVTEPDPTVAVASTLIFLSTLLILFGVALLTTRRRRSDA
jgi:putative spermidine/putrescine transport system permease protein